MSLTAALSASVRAAGSEHLASAESRLAWSPALTES